MLMNEMELLLLIIKVMRINRNITVKQRDNRERQLC